MRNLQYVLRSLKPRVTEIATHPALYDAYEAETYPHENMVQWLQSAGRQQEIEALLADTIRQEAQNNNIKLIRFCDMTANK